MKRRDFASVICFLLGITFIIPTLAEATVNKYGIETDNPYVVSRKEVDGDVIETVIVPGRPPENYRAPVAEPPASNVRRGTSTLSGVPAFDWCYGCSATSAAMMFGYYDRISHANMYTGPTDGGFCPLTNAVWGVTNWPTGTVSECPLSATHMGFDGRTTRGHADDYWIAYGNSGPDPYFTNGWTEHTHADCTADFMGTNQAGYLTPPGPSPNTDGSTYFSWWQSGKPMCDYTGDEPPGRDGCHGMKLFVESRGYSVETDGNFTQLIMGHPGTDPGVGFTFADYKAEINAGRPVLIQVVGHTMLGVGYNDPDTVYLHDTWDYSVHSMTWGGTYYDNSGNPMKHQAVTVCRLTGGAPVPTPPPVPTYRLGDRLKITITVSPIADYYWGYYGYSRCIMPNGNILTIFNNRISPYNGPLVHFYGLPNGYSGNIFDGYIPYSIPVGEYLFDIIIIQADLYQGLNNATVHSTLKIDVQP